MLDRLDAARARELGFVADAAHELRSPVASMRMQIDVARRLHQGGEVIDDLDVDVARMSSLVEDLLVMARIDAGAGVGADPGPAYVREVLAEAIATVSPTLRVEVDAGPDPAVRAQPGELVRVFSNLLANATRYASAVEVSVEQDDAVVVVRFDDDGPGIAPADRERAFERFTRLDEARDRDSGGAGLGLAIVRETVRSCGGDVALEESPQGGLRVEVRLPADARVWHEGMPSRA
jgi:signal transduction histidine kinase